MPPQRAWLSTSPSRSLLGTRPRRTCPVACHDDHEWVLCSSRVSISIPWNRETAGAIPVLIWIELFAGKIPPRLVNPEAWPRYAKRFEGIFGFAPAPLVKTTLCTKQHPAMRSRLALPRRRDPAAAHRPGAGTNECEEAATPGGSCYSRTIRSSVASSMAAA